MNSRKKSKLIEKAKGLLKDREQAKWEICRIAIELCEIKTGGHKVRKGDKKPYTMCNFADDIGLHRKTLSNWVLGYRRVVVNIDYEPEDFRGSDACTFSGAVERTRKRVKEDEAVENVQYIFSEEFNRDRYERQHQTFTKSIKHLESWIDGRKYEKVSAAKRNELFKMIDRLSVKAQSARSKSKAS